jgi:hypothetical protein
VLRDPKEYLAREMLGLASFLAIAIFTLVNGKQQPTPSAKWSKVPDIQKQVNHGSMMTHTLIKLPKLAVTHMAGSTLRHTDIPQIQHKKKPGEGYEKGSPLYDKQQDKQQKRKSTDFVLPLSPSGGRDRPNLTVVLGCMFVGVMVIIIAACVNRDFLVHRHLAGGELPVAPPPRDIYIKPDIDVGRPPPMPSTRFADQPRAQVEYLDPVPLPKSSRLDTTLPPQQVPLPQPRFGEPSVSMMPSKQLYPGPPMQKLGSGSISLTGNSPPGSQGVILAPQVSISPTNLSLAPQVPISPTQQVIMPNMAPPGAIIASMPPQQPVGFLPPPRSYATMPPSINVG